MLIGIGLSLFCIFCFLMAFFHMYKKGEFEPLWLVLLNSIGILFNVFMILLWLTRI
jgi:hypothetical protein